MVISTGGVVHTIHWRSGPPPNCTPILALRQIFFILIDSPNLPSATKSVPQKHPQSTKVPSTRTISLQKKVHSYQSILVATFTLRNAYRDAQQVELHCTYQCRSGVPPN